MKNHQYNVTKDIFFIEGCMLFEQPFVTNNRILAIPELWKIIQQRDECYNIYLSPYCENYYSCTNEPDGFLDITNIKFLQGIEICNKLCLFLYAPIELQWGSETNFYNNPIYQQIQSDLICIGYNVTGSQGSALTDGLYPIYLDNGINGNIVLSKTISYIKVNRFGLLNTFQDCLLVCQLNNNSSFNDETIYWRPQKIFVDKYTYSKMLILSQNSQ